MFGATPQETAAALPEAATPARFLHDPGSGRVGRSLEELDNRRTWLKCSQPDYLHYD